MLQPLFKSTTTAKRFEFNVCDCLLFFMFYLQYYFIFHIVFVAVSYHALIVVMFAFDEPLCLRLSIYLSLVPSQPNMSAACHYNNPLCWNVIAMTSTLPIKGLPCA